MAYKLCYIQEPLDGVKLGIARYLVPTTLLISSMSTSITKFCGFV